MLLTKKDTRRILGLPLFMALLVAAIGCGVTDYLYRQAQQQIHFQLQTTFEAEVDGLKEAVLLRLRVYDQALHATAGLFAASETVSRAEFAQFVERLALDEHFPGFNNIAYSPRVLAAQKQAHIQMVRAEGLRDYRIFPEGEREQYVPLLYVAPVISGLVGLDVWTQPVTRAVKAQARDSGEDALSDMISLVQDAEAKPGFLLAEPLYAKGCRCDTLAARQAGVVGWISAAFTMREFMSAMMSPTVQAHLGVSVFDGDSLERGALMFDSDADPAPERQSFNAAVFNQTQQLDFAGHRWTLRVHSLPAMELPLRDGSSQILVAAGLMITGLLALLIGLLLHRREQALHRVTSRLEESEHRFEDIANTAPVMIWICGTDKQLTWLNTAHLAFVGRSMDEERGTGWLDNVHAEDVPGLVSRFDAAFAAREAFNLYYRLRRHSGDYFWMHTSGGPRYTAEGRFCGFVGVCSNFDELMRANQEQDALLGRLQANNETLAQTTAQLQQTIDERDTIHNQLLHAQKLEVYGQLTAGIAHDFNNILAVIMGYNTMAMEDVATQPVPVIVEHLRKVEHASQRARDLIRKMMDYVRQSEDRKQAVVCDPLPPVSEAVLMLNAAVGSTIALHSALQTVPQVGLDGTDINQLVTNLVVNARDAIGMHGEITVRLAYSHYPAQQVCNYCKQALAAHGEQAYVVLQVQDSGSGISPQQLDRIFDPFFTTKEVGKGTGLGLSVISGIVHQAHGHIVVDSTEGVGTTFSILLPPVDSSTMQQATAPQADKPVSAKQNLSILVVDDEPLVLAIMENRLTLKGHRVTAVDSGQKALALVTDAPHGFDLIVTDYSMPEFDGMMLVNAVLQLRPDMPIFICSGLDLDPDTLPATVRNFRKPLNFDRFFAALAEV